MLTPGDVISYQKTKRYLSDQVGPALQETMKEISGDVRIFFPLEEKGNLIKRCLGYLYVSLP